MNLDHLMETEAEELERLSSAPEGSTYHGISQLPVRIPHVLPGYIIELERLPNSLGERPVERLTVVPVEKTGKGEKLPDGRFQRNGGFWRCLVVRSDWDAYPVGGHQLDISEAELSRGERIHLW